MTFSFIYSTNKTIYDKKTRQGCQLLSRIADDLKSKLKMVDLNIKMEKMLFVHETTYSTDYRYTDIKAPIPTVYKEKPSHRVTHPPLKDVHTLSNWKTEAIPFNLLHKPRDIIDTDPRKKQEPSEKHHDYGREEARKTRPRLIMTPAVSLDDIDNPTTRDILCNDIYTSAVTRATRDAAASYSSIAAPLPGLPAPANPIYLPKLKAPYVSPEWRMDSVSWDNHQLRGYCDYTKQFWMRRPLSKCRVCEQSAIVHAHRKIK